MVAYFVLSHVNAPQLVRLVRRLAGAPDSFVFVHHTYARDPLPPDAFADCKNVRLVKVRDGVTWGSFGQVEAVLDGMKEALESGVRYDWMVLLSGQDYPCTDLAAFHRQLETSGVDGFLDYVPIGDDRLGRENRDRYYFRYARVPAGLAALNARLWRLNHLQPFVRFMHSRLGSFVGVADRRPFARRRGYRGSFWWALSRACTEELVEVVRTQPDLVDAYRHRLHPDESFVQTALLANPAFVFANDDLRYIRWVDTQSGSPVILGTADIPAILAARKPFARKFDTRVDANVLDALDTAVAASSTARPVLSANFARGTKPRLTIGMPVYNGENYLAQAIDSILNQTYTDFELVISDNASRDATPDIVLDVAAKDRRVRYVRNPQNMGASYNFNRTFALARGEFFRQAAHDDTLAPTCLERCIEVLDRDPSVSLAYTRSVCIDESDRVLAEYANVMHFVSDDPTERFAAHLRRAFDRSPEANHGSNPACNPIFGIGRTAMLARTPMVANYIASDMILLGELALYGKLYEVPETLFFIRAHPTTSWAQNPTALDVAAWFDPANRRRVMSYLPHARWFYEYLRAIRRAPLSVEERQGCFDLLIRWAAEHREPLMREGLSVGARFFGLRRWDGETRRRFGLPHATA